MRHGTRLYENPNRPATYAIRCLDELTCCPLLVKAKCLEIMPDYDVGCFNKQCNGSLAISPKLVPEIVKLNMATEDIFSSRSFQSLNKFSQGIPCIC